MWDALVDLIRSYAARNRADAQQKNKEPFQEGRYAFITSYSTFAAAVLAFVAAIAFWFQFGAMQDETFQANRAWVAPINARPLEVKQPSKRILYGVNLPNLGKGPGTNMRWSMDSYLIHVPASRDYRTAKFRENNLCDGLSPDANGGEASYPSQADQPAPTKTEITKPGIVWGGDVASGSQAIVIRGCIAYETVSRTGHSAYCFIFDKLNFSPDLTKVTWLTVPCPNGNFAK